MNGLQRFDKMRKAVKKAQLSPAQALHKYEAMEAIVEASLVWRDSLTAPFLHKEPGVQALKLIEKVDAYKALLEKRKAYFSGQPTILAITKRQRNER